MKLDTLLARISAALTFAVLALGMVACHPTDPAPVATWDDFLGPGAPVEIVRDGLGIPHIYARSDADAFFAAGYQVATERLFQMDLVRRRALGRQAEVLGEDYVSQDQTSRMLGFRRWGELNARRLGEEAPELHNLLVAWTAGVNRRIEEVLAGPPAELPYGFGANELDYLPEAWAPADQFAIAKMISFGSSSSLERELLATLVNRYLPVVWSQIELARPLFASSTMPPDELPPAGEVAAAPSAAAPHGTPAAPVPGMEEAAERFERLRAAFAHLRSGGSNNWALDGRHTANGRPLVAGDPHQPLESPSILYAQHLNSADAGGRLDVIGWAFAGFGPVALGHNRELVWTATNNFADVSDLWSVEPLSGGSEVNIGGVAMPVVTQNEVISVAGGAPVVYETRRVEGYGVILPARFSPLPATDPGRELLFNWNGFEATQEEQVALRMGLAASRDDFEAAVDFGSPFNFVAADGSGISYRVTNRVPDHGDPSARQMPYLLVDGDDPATFWGPWLPPEKLPRSRAEQRGWIATANNDPWGFTFDGDVSNDPWYYGYFYAAGYRASRIEGELARLAGRGDVDLEDMKTLQTDTYAVSADILIPMLEEVYGRVDSDPALSQYRGRPDLDTLFAQLSQWDRRMERESSAAVIYHLWLHFLSEDTIGDDLGIYYSLALAVDASFVLKFAILALSGQYPESDALLQEGRDELIMGALDTTAGFLTDRMGSVDPAGYSWGALHGTEFANPFGGRLDGGWTPTAGSEATVDYSPSSFTDGAGQVAERWDSHSGPVFRMVAGFDGAGSPQAWFAFPRGNSGDPDSPHWDDTLEDWVEGRYQRLPFTRAEVDGAAESTFILPGAPGVAIDVLPADESDEIAAGDPFPIPVALLGSEQLDAEAVDLTTLGFGPQRAVVVTNPFFPGPSYADVDGDGRVDLVAHFVPRESGLAVGDTEACVSGVVDGVGFRACGPVRVE